MATSFSTEQTLPITFKVTDGRGRVVDIDGTPAVASSDDTVAAIGDMTKNSDLSWSGEVNSGIPGTATVTVTADADLGDGVLEVIGTLDVEVTLDPRTSARISTLEAGTPADKPVAPTPVTP